MAIENTCIVKTARTEQNYHGFIVFEEYSQSTLNKFLHAISRSESNVECMQPKINCQSEDQKINSL